MFSKAGSLERFESFEQVDLTFRTVDGNPLLATVLTPKHLRSQPAGNFPVLVHWHGGGFIVGHRMYDRWFAKWVIDLALANDAMIISPDYRLLPESSGPDIMSDVSTFWTWLHNSLPVIAEEEDWHSKPDLTKIACYGQSSGGYLAVQSSLLEIPDVPNGHADIKCIISTSAPLQADVPSFKVPKPRRLLGKQPPATRQAEAIIQNYIRRHVRADAMRTGCDPADPEMWELVMCIFQQCYIPRLFGYKKKGNDWLDLMKMLDKLADQSSNRLPAIWVVHGEKDSMVPYECSSMFVDKVQRVLPDVPVFFSSEPGDHSFDVEETSDTPWVKSGYEFVKQHWP